jgi:hypothetical protein
MPVLAWPIREKSLEPCGKRQFGGRLHDRVGGESGLMAACAALKALGTAAVNSTLLMACAAKTADAIVPAGFFQSSLTVLLAAVEPLELRQEEALFELDRAASHGLTGISVPLYGPVSLGVERAGKSRNPKLSSSADSLKQATLTVVVVEACCASGRVCIGS